MQAKNTSPKPLVSVYAEKGVLAFRFSSKYNSLFEILDGKPPTKQRTMGLGLRESPENWKLAQSAALRIERDLSDSENWQILFDPTFVKYGLAVKYSAAALKLAAPIPEIEPEMTVGAMWEEYLLWKKPQLQPTTFEFKFNRAFINALKGLVWNGKTKLFTDTQNGVWDMLLCSAITEKILTHKMNAESRKSLVSALSEAFTRLQSQGRTKLTKNPFILENKTENKTDKYESTVDVDGSINCRWCDKDDTERNPEEKDRRAFTKDERDIIIKAFYESARYGDRNIAPLVEFLFLTGCRPGEAYALEWKDVFLGRNNDYVRFSRSYNGQLKNTQQTKTGEIRLFKMYPKLRDLLLRIKPDTAQPNDLVFTNTRGDAYNSGCMGIVWNGKPEKKKDGTKDENPGVVSRLVLDGAISRYLAPYHTRHTFITLMAQAGTDLLLLATACGNSVEVIQRHYLGVDTEALFPNI